MYGGRKGLPAAARVCHLFMLGGRKGLPYHIGGVVVERLHQIVDSRTLQSLCMAAARVCRRPQGSAMCLCRAAARVCRTTSVVLLWRDCTKSLNPKLTKFMYGGRKGLPAAARVCHMFLLGGRKGLPYHFGGVIPFHVAVSQWLPRFS
jgi:hypothetical protein